MKLTILGNNGPFPALGGACSGYLLISDSGRTKLLLDCGTGVLGSISKYVSLSALDAVVLSHLHYDHMSDMLAMQYALQFDQRKDALSVYAPETPEGVRAMLKANVFSLKPIVDTSIGEMTLQFFPGRHPVESYAMRICCDQKVFVYTGDTNTVDGMAEFAMDADLLLADAGLDRAHWHEDAPHYSAMHCALLAKEAKCKRLLLTHYNPSFEMKQLEAEAQAVLKEARFARIGESIII